ncbi:DUF6692 family protein [Pacificimonas flava]|uniref:DUF6692 family protein n=1 Tax=Pacificimonas flava TaxID=1234595 RepID=UPI00057058A7|nr:DUF6692 family protein [Pacificimonas flava]MBB5279082.1 hypothetical protein [Pacificimonas flava]
MNLAVLIGLGAILALAACNKNTAAGNDQEAGLEEPAKPAPRVPAASALANVDPAVLYPGTMTPADIKSLGGRETRCLFSMTEVGFPSLLFSGSRRDATIKLNGKLITLPESSDGNYGQAGLQIRIYPVDRQSRRGGLRESEMVVYLPGAPDELGFRGFQRCNS